MKPIPADISCELNEIAVYLHTRTDDGQPLSAEELNELAYALKAYADVVSTFRSGSGPVPLRLLPLPRRTPLTVVDDGAA